MGDRIRTGRRWRLTVGSMVVAVAVLAVTFAAIRATMSPYWAATEAMRRNGNGPLLSKLQARSALRVGPGRWQVRYVDTAVQREVVVTLTDEEVRKARFLPW